MKGLQFCCKHDNYIHQ